MPENGMALVTGASSGIGRQTAVMLAEKGFKVIAIARRTDRLKELADRHSTIVPKSVDLSIPNEVEAFCEELESGEMTVSALVNNAGYSVRGVLEDISLKAIRRLYEVNVFSLIKITQACLPGMRRLRKGTIVNVSSMVGKIANPLNGIYSSTKHAVEAISDALRLEVLPFGIRVVSVRPGPIATEFHTVAKDWEKPKKQAIIDYEPIYEAAGSAIQSMLKNITMGGPEIVATSIVDAILADNPKPSLLVGPLVQELLAQRMQLSDEAFFDLMSETSGLRTL